ncbi:MAG: hypothetical protein QXS68_07235 [Candidatus Methanomethylicaceae archaeon]
MDYQKTLTSLAVLKVNYERLGRSYLDCFTPFVVYCLQQHLEERVQIEVLVDSILENFGLNIPYNVVVEILKRAARSGYVHRVEGSFVIDRDQVSRNTFKKLRQEVLRAHSELLRSFIRHCETITGRIWNEEEAEELLMAYLGRYNAPLALQMSSVPIVRIPDPVDTEQFRLVASFIKRSREQGGLEFEHITTLAQGMMLANSLYYEPGKITSRFRDAIFYFDTTFLIFALGYAGEVRQAPCVELLEMLYEKGANLACFTHTLEEIQDILHAISENMGSATKLTQISGVRREVVDYFMRMKYTSSDVRCLYQQLSKRLSARGIKIIDRPSAVSSPEHAIDETAIRQQLEQRIRYSSERAILRDVDSVSGIALLRRGHKPIEIETCRAVLVTTNTGLVEVVREFFSRDMGYGKHHVPICISDVSLTVLLWLKSSLKSPSLPLRRIIADAYAALQPPDHVWKLYLAELDNLRDRGDITEEDVLLMRYSSEAFEVLNERIASGRSITTEQDVYQMLEEVKSSVSSERIRKVEERLEKVSERLSQRDAVLRESLAIMDAQIEKLRFHARRVGECVAVVSSIIVAALLAVASFGLSGYVTTSLPNWASNTIRVLATLLAFSFSLFGINLLTIKRTVSLKISEKTFHLIAKFTGVERYKSIMQSTDTDTQHSRATPN